MTTASAADRYPELVSTSGTARKEGPGEARQALIDVAKGIGILLVVFGHNGWMSSSHQAINHVASSFRLPLFFFMAGVTFPAGRSFATVLWRRSEAMLKPYVAVVVLLAAWQFMAGTGSIEFVTLELIYATGFTLSWEPLWFLPHLWLLSVFCAALLSVVKPWLRSTLARVLLLSMMIMLGYGVLRGFHNPLRDDACFHVSHFTSKLWQCGLPFSADVLLISAFYLLLGHFLASHVKRFKPSVPLAMLAVATFLGLLLWFHYTINLNFRQYDGMVVSTLQAIAAIYLVITLCWCAKWLPIAQRAIAYVGSGSLFVLLFHYPIQAKALRLGAYLHAPDWLAGIASFLCAIALSLVLWEVAKRSQVLSSLLLPTPSSDRAVRRDGRSALEV